MPDISMCRNETCPKKELCGRYRAIPSSFQSYANFLSPANNCFWDLKKFPYMIKRDAKKTVFTNKNVKLSNEK